MKIFLWPQEDCLADELVNIRVVGLKAGECYTFLLSIVDENLILFVSHAYYLANCDGEIDLRRDAALHTNTSSYSGTFSSGLFSTLKPTTQYKRLIRRDVSKPLQYLLSIWAASSPPNFPAISNELLHRLTVDVLSKNSTKQFDKENHFDSVANSMHLGSLELDKAYVSDLFRNSGLLRLQRIDQYFMSSGSQRIVVREGNVRGTLFIPKGLLLILTV